MILQPVTTKDSMGDNLFASNGVHGVVADGYTLAAATTGVILRGTALKQGATSEEVTPVAAAADAIVAIAAADIDTAVTKAIPVYLSGEFNRYAIILPSGVTYADVQVKARANSIYLKDVVKGV